MDKYEPQFVKTLQGATLLLLDGFTFNKNGTMVSGRTRYVCSKTSKGCKARVFLDSNNKVINYFNDHNHGCIKYIITRNGYFVKVD
ncbi:hypothetical protein HF086_005621 [Spodoptera exigua]|uniref:FLYWCH-type domain-containing protein n=1 Tax=Spodoptera exigua TaxID=7107 RepID=A0A922SPP4_SPOEX|nr:hypothetical protein HF086_005621 [Spodoptera exigua]